MKRGISIKNEPDRTPIEPKYRIGSRVYTTIFTSVVQSRAVTVDLSRAIKHQVGEWVPASYIQRALENIGTPEAVTLRFEREIPAEESQEYTVKQITVSQLITGATIIKYRLSNNVEYNEDDLFGSEREAQEYVNTKYNLTERT